VNAAVACTYCGAELDPDGPATYRLVGGWEQKAIAGSRRGGSDIVCRRPADPPTFACRICVGKLQDGVSPDQQALL
jgi:hypothetical protein